MLMCKRAAIIYLLTISTSDHDSSFYNKKSRYIPLLDLLSCVQETFKVRYNALVRKHPCSADVSSIGLKVLHQAPQKGVLADTLTITYEAAVSPCPGHSHIHASLVR